MSSSYGQRFSGSEILSFIRSLNAEKFSRSKKIPDAAVRITDAGALRGVTDMPLFIKASPQYGRVEVPPVTYVYAFRVTDTGDGAFLVHFLAPAHDGPVFNVPEVALREFIDKGHVFTDEAHARHADYSDHRADEGSALQYADFLYNGISFDDAERRLLPTEVGTYLLRTSQREPNTLVIAWKSAPGVVEQSLLRALSNGRYSINDGTEVESIPAFLHANAGKLLYALKKVQRPSKSSVDLSYYNHGAISFAEAERRLLPQPVGTFFLRSSSLPNTVVVCVRGADDVVQFRAHEQSDGFYVTDDGSFTFRTIDDLIRPDQWTQHPLSRYAFYHVGITYDDTVALLSNEPVGTYLTRPDDRDPSNIVIAFKNPSGHVDQVVAKYDGEGYRIPNEDGTYLTFQTTDALLAAFSGLLLNPLLVTSGGAGGAGSGHAHEDAVHPLPSAPDPLPTAPMGGRRNRLARRTATSEWARLVQNVHASRKARHTKAAFKDSLRQASTLYHR